MGIKISSVQDSIDRNGLKLLMQSLGFYLLLERLIIYRSQRSNLWSNLEKYMII